MCELYVHAPVCVALCVLCVKFVTAFHNQSGLCILYLKRDGDKSAKNK